MTRYRVDEDEVAVSIELTDLAGKPGEPLDPTEIDACLDHTVGKVGDSARPAEG